MSKWERKYTGVLQFFHNFEHSEEGTTHCIGPGSNPYTIEHKNGKHIISLHHAKGHGRGNESQWFYFPKKLGSGYDMASGIKVDSRTATEASPWSRNK